MVALFQVCSSWHSVSYSESLWKNLLRSVWDIPEEELIMEGYSWKDAYIRKHRTATNFITGRGEYTLLEYEMSSSGSSSSSSNNGSSCRRLSISRHYIAGGFSDGAVRVFSLENKECITTLRPLHESRIGPHSRTIVGLALDENYAQVVFASLDGNVFVGDISDGSYRRAVVGNYVNDGILVDFTSSPTRWAGLYAGVVGHALHIWDAYSEDLMYNGGDMTDADAYEGWHLLVDNADHIGRIKTTQDKLLVIATRRKLCVMDMESLDIVFNLQSQTQLLTGSLAVARDHILVVYNNGAVRILKSDMMQEVRRFHIRLSSTDNHGVVYAAMNSWHVFICNDGLIDAWERSSVQHLYRLQSRVSEASDLVANDQCIACCGREDDIHLWDFS